MATDPVCGMTIAEEKALTTRRCRSLAGSSCQEGLRIVMLTGDNRTTADAVARHLGLEPVRASQAGSWERVSRYLDALPAKTDTASRDM
jgi:hypothetical protein